MDSATQVETPHVLQNAGVVAKGNQHTDSTALLISVEDVLVTERYRQDLGELDDLVSSIVEVGLLNPITVREWHGGYRLVAGERRLSAFKKLGLSEIPARVARDIADARDALIAERDENTARKEMLPSEKTALGMAIEEMERPKAKARQGIRNDLIATSAPLDAKVKAHAAILRHCGRSSWYVWVYLPTDSFYGQAHQRR